MLTVLGALYIRNMSQKFTCYISLSDHNSGKRAHLMLGGWQELNQGPCAAADDASAHDSAAMLCSPSQLAGLD